MMGVKCGACKYEERLIIRQVRPGRNQDHYRGEDVWGFNDMGIGLLMGVKCGASKHEERLIIDR